MRPPAIAGKLLIATTRTSPRPRSDLAIDYRLAWLSQAGLDPVHLPGEEQGVVAAAMRPGDGSLLAIVGNTTLLRYTDDGRTVVDLLPHLSGVVPGNVNGFLSVAWAGEDRVLVRQTPPTGMFSMEIGGQQRTPLALNGLDPAASPDGQHVALGYAGDRPYYSIHVAQAPFTNLNKLTSDSLPEAVPAWSPDGAWIAYTAQVAGSTTRPFEWEVRAIRADGTQERTIVPAEPGIGYSSVCWSPDGSRVAFTRYDEGAHSRQIGSVDLDGSGRISISDAAANDRVLGWRP